MSQLLSTTVLVRSFRWLVVFSIMSMAGAAHFVLAAPITSGKGPGGVGLVDGTSTLKLWFKGDVGLNNSAGNVTTWLDSSGNNYTATAGSSAPAYTASGLNGLPTATFGGAATDARVLNVSSSAAGIAQNITGITMFAVVDHTTTPASGQQYLNFTTGDGTNVSRASLRANGAGGNPTVVGRRLDADAVAVAGGAGSTLTTPIVASGIINYGSNDGFRYTDGSLSGSSLTFGTAGSTSNTPSNAITIGNLPGATPQQMVGDISEVIAFNTVVNSAQRIVIENYLSSKYNAGSVLAASDRSLAANDWYLGDTTAKGNYDFHVFGVGKDAAGVLFASTGESGFGIDVTTSTLANDNWAFAGRNTNDSTNSLTAGNLGTTGLSTRWSRDWYVDAQGAFAATLAFNFADADLTAPSDASAYTLLFRPNLLADFTAVSSPVVISGQNFLFNLTSGQLGDGYYTLGFFQPVPEPASAAWLAMFGVVWCNRLRRARATR